MYYHFSEPPSTRWILGMTAFPPHPHLPAVCHQRRSILLKSRVRNCTFLLSSPSTVYTAECPCAQGKRDKGTDGGVYCDSGAGREIGPALFQRFWERLGEDLGDGGIARGGFDTLVGSGLVAVRV